MPHSSSPHKMSVFSQKNIIGKTPCRTVMHQLPYEAQPSTLRPPPTRWKRPHKAFHFHTSQTELLSPPAPHLNHNTLPPTRQPSVRRRAPLCAVPLQQGTLGPGETRGGKVSCPRPLCVTRRGRLTITTLSLFVSPVVARDLCTHRLCTFASTSYMYEHTPRNSPPPQGAVCPLCPAGG